jgi:Protein of unknown function (DUF1761)
MLLDFGDVNIWAVLLATVASLALGFPWYGPPLFGKQWQKEVGLSDKDIEKANMGKTFGLTVLASIVSASFIGALLHTIADSPSVIQGLVFGGAVATGLIATSLLGNYLFAQKSFTLWGIDAFYWVGNAALAGAIAAWLW